jgi:hypothetical protein
MSEEFGGEISSHSLGCAAGYLRQSVVAALFPLPVKDLRVIKIEQRGHDRVTFVGNLRHWKRVFKK